MQPTHSDVYQRPLHQISEVAASYTSFHPESALQLACWALVVEVEVDLVGWAVVEAAAVVEVEAEVVHSAARSVVVDLARCSCFAKP